MRALDNYRIDIYKLPNKTHSFDFEFENSFFELFENSIIEKGKGTCHLELMKEETMMTADFQIDAEVELICDRSLEPFMFPIKKSENLLIKFGEEDVELGDEIISIHRDTQSLNIAQNIFEYLTISIPMKKLHPKFEGEEETDDLIYSSDDFVEEEEENEETLDPRWEALRNLKKQ
ncbi:MAG: DUF177 domain-containing protein [bacterium]|nr:DUF177 domain-containing protein [bacterium]